MLRTWTSLIQQTLEPYVTSSSVIVSKFDIFFRWIMTGVRLIFFFRLNIYASTLNDIDCVLREERFVTIIMIITRKYRFLYCLKLFNSQSTFAMRWNHIWQSNDKYAMYIWRRFWKFLSSVWNRFETKYFIPGFLSEIDNINILSSNWPIYYLFKRTLNKTLIDIWAFRLAISLRPLHRWKYVEESLKLLRNEI